MPCNSCGYFLSKWMKLQTRTLQLSGNNTAMYWSDIIFRLLTYSLCWQVNEHILFHHLSYPICKLYIDWTAHWANIHRCPFAVLNNHSFENCFQFPEKDCRGVWSRVQKHCFPFRIFLWPLACSLQFHLRHSPLHAQCLCRLLTRCTDILCSSLLPCIAPNVSVPLYCATHRNRFTLCHFQSVGWNNHKPLQVS